MELDLFSFLLGMAFMYCLSFMFAHWIFFLSLPKPVKSAEKPEKKREKDPADWWKPDDLDAEEP